MNTFFDRMQIIIHCFTFAFSFEEKTTTQDVNDGKEDASYDDYDLQLFSEDEKNKSSSVFQTSMEDFVTVDPKIVPDSSKQERSLDEKMDDLLSKFEKVMNLVANERKQN